MHRLFSAASSLRNPTLLLLALLFTLCSHDGFAQMATLRGFTLDEANGEVLPGVHLVLEASSGQQQGYVSNTDGYYIITGIAPGRYILRGSYVGYATFVDTLSLEAGTIENRDLLLKPSETVLDEVTVEAAQGSEGGLTKAGLHTIRPKDLERLPMPDVSGDLAGYLQLAPGTVTPGDRGGQLFVRGGTPSQNLILVDDMVVYQPFHLIGFFSAIPSDILRQADFYAGGFEARYGGRLSSVVDVTTRDGDKQQFRGAASVAPFLSAIRLEGPLQQGRVSFLMSVRESMVERVLPSVWGGALPFRFGDHFLKVHSRLGAGSQLSFTALRSHDEGVVDDTEFSKASEAGEVPSLQQRNRLPDEAIRWTNSAYGMRYLLLPPGVPLLAEITLSISHFNNEFGQPDLPERRSSVRTVRNSATISQLRGPWTVRGGVVVQSIALDYDLGGTFQEVEADEQSATDAAFFAEGDGQIGDFRVYPGLHAHLYASADLDTSIEPRLRGTWKPGGASGRYEVSAAWGLFSQNVIGLQDERDAGDVFTAWVTKPFRSRLPRAMHAILGGQIKPRPDLQFGLEGYFKTLSNLSIPAWSAFPSFTTTLQSADGRVWGLDLRAEVDREPFYLFAGYGLASVQYIAQQESFGVWYGTTQERFHPPHDQRHQLNLLGSFQHARWQFNARWQYGSGLPFTRPFGFDDWILLETLLDVREEPGAYRVLFEQPYQGRLPTYHRLDLSVERTVPLGAALLTLQAGVVNAYDRRNLFYFDLWTLRRVDQLAWTPSFGLKLESL